MKQKIEVEFLTEKGMGIILVEKRKGEKNKFLLVDETFLKTNETGRSRASFNM